MKKERKREREEGKKEGKKEEKKKGKRQVFFIAPIVIGPRALHTPDYH